MGIISTQGFTFRLIANGTQLDLFDDEDIQLSNNVTGLFDIGVLPSDFTRQITLPGTKVNNAFFEHVYDISIDSPFLFATNIKVPAYFDFDSVYLSQGYLQLNKVNVRANKFIESYEVTIYGTLSSFGRDINRNFLTDLDSLSQYNHTSSYANISASWNGNLFNGDIVYPLADYGTGWKYTAGDVFFGLDDSEGGMTVADFKPAIRIKPVLDAIFTEAGFTYSSSFFNQSWIDNVYMICNNSLKYPEYSGIDLETYGVIKISPFSGSNQTNLVINDSTQTLLPWYNVEKDPTGLVGQNATYTIEKETALRGVLNLEVQLSGSLGGPTIELKVINTSSLAAVSSTSLVNFNTFFNQNTYAMFAEGANGQNKTYSLQTEFNTGVLTPGTYYFGIEWFDQFSAPYNNFKFTLDPGNSPKSYLEINKQLQIADGRIMDIPSNMPYGTTGIKQIDFLVGLQKKFNLVMYPDKTKNNQFIIETFNEWYNKGQRWDFNKYINLDEIIEVIPANNLAVNQLNFGDTLDQDYISQQFSKEANREYGKTYYIDTENFFSQGKFEVKTTFGNGPLVKIPGTGLSGSVGGVNPPAPTSTQYVIGNAGWSSDYAACSNTYYYPTIVYAAESDPSLVTTLYTDANLTTPFDGGYSYWKWGFPYFYQKYSSFILFNGSVQSFLAC
jgi:hypothetical protein